jgi:ParB family transcriptional regulator, chromosome partitioning protein
MRTQIQEKLCALVLAANIRATHGEEEDLRRLARSYLQRPIHPLVVRVNREVIDGNRRVLGLRLELGEESEQEVDCLLTDEDLTPDLVKEMQFLSAMHRADLTSFEKWRACEDFQLSHPDWSQKQLAEYLHLDPSMVTRLLSPGRCIKEWRDALQAGTVGIGDIYAASRLPKEQQLGLLTLKLSGASRDAIEKAGRQALKQATAAPEEKVGRVKVALPTGVSIVLSGQGQELTLSATIDALSDALKAARRAQDEGLSAKSWTAAMKDKATRKGD